MTSIHITLDVASLRDKHIDEFRPPTVSFNLNSQEFVVELSNIPADESDRIRVLREELDKARAELWNRPEQGAVDYWRAQYDASQRELQAKHAPEDLKEIVRSHISSGTKISAIKAIREVTGWGLKEAKDFVDMVWGTPAPSNEGV